MTVVLARYSHFLCDVCGLASLNSWLFDLRIASELHVPRWTFLPNLNFVRLFFHEVQVSLRQTDRQMDGRTNNGVQCLLEQRLVIPVYSSYEEYLRKSWNQDISVRKSSATVRNSRPRLCKLFAKRHMRSESLISKVYLEKFVGLLGLSVCLSVCLLTR